MYRARLHHVFLIAFIFLSTNVPIAHAHVGYVLGHEEFTAKSGSDFAFILHPLTDPKNIILMIATAVGAFVLYYIVTKTGIYKQVINRIQKKADEYKVYFSWMLRLSIGIALIGAGSSNVLISQVVKAPEWLSFIQILLGFLLLLGFATSLVTLAILVLFIWSLFSSVYLLGNLEFFAAVVSLFLLADPRPGFDDLFGIPFYSTFTRFKKYFPLVLRIGIGGAMIFLAVYEKLLNPHIAAAVVEKYELTSIIPVAPSLWVLGAGITELAIGLLLLIGFHTRLASAIAFAVLSLSFFYFGEDVYSHITLFGVLSVLFVTGSGALGVDKLRTL